MEQMNPIATPFADNGEKNTITSDSQSTSVVNWNKGFPSDFSKSTSVGGKFVKRKDINGILNYLSAAIKYLQKGGQAIFNTAFIANGGTYKTGSALWFYNDSKKTWQLVIAQQDTTVAPSNSNVSQGTIWKPFCLLPYNGNRLTLQEVLDTKAMNVGGNMSVTGNITMSGRSATGCPTPTTDDGFANKGYVDNMLLSNNSSMNIIAGESTYPDNPTVDIFGRSWARNNVYEFTMTRNCMLMVEYGGRSSGSLNEVSIHLAANPTSKGSPKCIFVADGTANNEQSSLIPLKKGTKIYVRIGSESSQSLPSVRMTEMYN